MKAPDKIYLGIQDLGSGYAYDLSLDNNGEQEYFRKDFIKAEIEKKIKELPEEWNGAEAAKWAYIDVLNLIDIKSALN